MTTRTGRVICDNTISADGYSAGLNQTGERPFGDDGGDGSGSKLHAWMFDTRGENRAEIDQMTAARAVTMGRNMFGPCTRMGPAEMARLVEIMVRWPWLLDALGARRPVGSEAKTVLADLMRASGDDEEWERVATSAHMDVIDESTVGLRELLLRRGGEPDTLIAIASRYL